MSASRLLSAVSAKVLNSTEDAHLKTMSTFETDEHLQAWDGLIEHAGADQKESPARGRA